MDFILKRKLRRRDVIYPYSLGIIHGDYPMRTFSHLSTIYSSV